MSIEARLAEYIRTNISSVERETLAPDDDLISEGLIDSLGIVQLLEYISEEFGIDIDADEIQPENFSSVGSLVALIDRKRGNSGT